MIPTIGRIVHYQPETDPTRWDVNPCRAALVTGLDYGGGQPVRIFLSVFDTAWHARPAVMLGVIVHPAVDDNVWHDPRECPMEPPT